MTQKTLSTPSKQCPNECSSIKPWLLATRPKTLTAAVVPFIAGTLLAYSTGSQINGWLLASALLSAICIQIATNFINDAFDFKRGADTSERLGPQRAIQAGAATQKQVYAWGIAFFCMSLVFGIPLIYHGGPIILLVLLVSIAAGYSYTGGPFPLAYAGLGDIFVIVFFGWTSTIAAYWLQSGRLDWNAFLLGTQIGFLCTLMIAVNNLRDVTGDKKVNKKTLPVRFGVHFGRMEIAILAIVPFLLNYFWFAQGYTYAAILPWLSFPLAIKLITKIWTTEPSKAYNGFLAIAAMLHLFFGLILSLGFYLQ